MQAPSKKKINLKLQSLTKTKRIREVPENFEALKQLVEALIKDERDLVTGQEVVTKGDRDYVIRYTDKEKELILKALKKHKNKRKYAAQDLGISERTLYRKLKQYDIED